MFLTKHRTDNSSRWALDGEFLSQEFDLKKMLALSQEDMPEYLSGMRTNDKAAGDVLVPIEQDQEVWASGVTYSRSRDAREAETEIKNIYDLVYDAERPELFFKAIGWRVKGTQSAIRIRKDSHWNVPEPELALVINRGGEIVGYCAGNDVSSRSIEGENPLYLPQAKMYDGSCALGPGILLTGAENMTDLQVRLVIQREGGSVFEGETGTSQIRRSFEELASFLTREMTFPFGVFLLTGTGIVPDEPFTLKAGDTVRITIGSLVLENRVES